MFIALSPVSFGASIKQSGPTGETELREPVFSSKPTAQPTDWCQSAGTQHCGPDPWLAWSLSSSCRLEGRNQGGAGESSRLPSRGQGKHVIVPALSFPTQTREGFLRLCRLSRDLDGDNLPGVVLLGFGWSHSPIPLWKATKRKNTFPHTP